MVNRLIKNQFLGLLRITRAPITPGIQPQSVSKKTIKKDPQPLSITDSGGNMIANNTLIKLISTIFQLLMCIFLAIQV